MWRARSRNLPFGKSLRWRVLLKNQFCDRFDKKQVPQNLANHLWPVGVLQSWSFSLFLVCINESSWPSDWFKNVMTNALQAPGGSFHVAPTSPSGGKEDRRLANLQNVDLTPPHGGMEDRALWKTYQQCRLWTRDRWVANLWQKFCSSVHKMPGCQE